MTPQIRLRRHTDGRYALKRGDEPWQFAVCVSEADMTGPDWSELLVTELPEPDGYDWVVDGTKEPYWRTRDDKLWALTDGVARQQRGLETDISGLASDALKMLAAVAACERYRAERETAVGGGER